MSYLTSFDRLCSPRAYFAVHARSAQALAHVAWPRTWNARVAYADPFYPVAYLSRMQRILPAA
uniref:Uncharacterized protein n=1 Tax=Solanum lycopersicum TaxID=4081 RepID=A0A494G9J4_SOLLC